MGVGTWLAAETTVEGTWFLLALAVGFASVWPLGYLARPAIRNLWPLIPASILAAVGLIAITGTEIEAPLGQFLVAAVLVLLGVGLILTVPRLDRLGRPERLGRDQRLRPRVGVTSHQA